MAAILFRVRWVKPRECVETTKVVFIADDLETVRYYVHKFDHKLHKWAHLIVVVVGVLIDATKTSSQTEQGRDRRTWRLAVQSDPQCDPLPPNPNPNNQPHHPHLHHHPCVAITNNVG